MENAPSDPSCIHHSICGDRDIELHWPNFFFEHPHSEFGGHWEVCIKCERTRYFAPIKSKSMRDIPILQKRELVFEPGFISPQEAAKLLGLEENTIRIYIRKGFLKGRQIENGGRKFWQVEILSVKERLENV